MLTYSNDGKQREVLHAHSPPLPHELEDASKPAWEGKLWNQPAHLKGQASPRLGMNLHFLSRLDPSPSGEDYPCMEHMRAIRTTAEAHPLAQKRHAAYTGSRPPRFAIW